MTPPEAGRLLGVSPPDLSRCRSLAEAEDAVQAWKDTVVKAAWRREVTKHHPDRATSDADREARTIATAKLNAAREVLNEVRAVRQVSRPALQVVIVSFGGRVGFGSTPAATTTAGWPWSF